MISGNGYKIIMAIIDSEVFDIANSDAPVFYMDILDSTTG